MKKLLAVLATIMILALSVVPAFAESVDSPSPTKANYQITIIPGPGGGTYDFDYKTPVGDDGKQTVHFTAKPDDGYKFTGWTFDGDYTTTGSLTDTEIDIIISGDIKVTPAFTKIGEESKKSDTDTKVDNSTKSPKTGYNANTIIAVSVASLAVVGLVFLAKKRNVK